jgi:hypothetical protein
MKLLPRYDDRSHVNQQISFAESEFGQDFQNALHTNFASYCFHSTECRTQEAQASFDINRGGLNVC